MVSANVFARVDELKTYAGCQGFIDKPVMESELLVLLGRELGLHWKYRAPTPPLAALAQPTSAARPAASERDTLAELARIGHIMAIRCKLDDIEGRDARLESFTAWLREPLAQFDLDTFIQRLQEADHVTH